ARRGCRERSQQDHDDNAFFGHFTARLAGGTGAARTAISARIFGHFTARLAGGTGSARTAVGSHFRSFHRSPRRRHRLGSHYRRRDGSSTRAALTSQTPSGVRRAAGRKSADRNSIVKNGSWNEEPRSVRRRDSSRSWRAASGNSARVMMPPSGSGSSQATSSPSTSTTPPRTSSNRLTARAIDSGRRPSV